MGTDPIKRERPRFRRRLGWWVACLLSLIAIVVAGIELTKRIGQYYEQARLPLFAYIEVVSTDFAFAGREVSLNEAADENGEPIIQVRYGQQEIDLPVVYPPKHELPTLFDRQREWLGMFFFADRSGLTLPQFERRIADDEIPIRLAIVTRTPFGFEPAKDAKFESIGREQNLSTADVRRDLFRYDFYEFKRDGTIEHESKRFPESGKSFLRRRINAELRGTPPPERAPDEIQEYTWQYGAAIKVTNRPPPMTQERQALLNAGWSLPVAAAGFLMLIVSFFFAIAPERVREGD